MCVYKESAHTHQTLMCVWRFYGRCVCGVESDVCVECSVMCVYRVAKIHRMPYLYRSFSTKEPYN